MLFPFFPIQKREKINKEEEKEIPKIKITKNAQKFEKVHKNILEKSLVKFWVSPFWH